MKIWRKRIADSIDQLINDEAVYRTAPATPGLLNITQYTNTTHTANYKNITQ